MKMLKNAIVAELIKIKHTPFRWITFAAFSLAPIMGGLIMLYMQSDMYAHAASALKIKAEMRGFSVDWTSFFNLLSQAVGIGGVLIFGFVASWIFGREYSDNTAKDMLSLPASRTIIASAKFIVFALWSLLLSFFIFCLGCLIGLMIQLPGLEIRMFLHNFKIFAITSLLAMLINIPVALFANIGKGYMAPLGFVVISMILAQIIGVFGIGQYFPWAVPALYSGSGGPEISHLGFTSFIILFTVSIAGYLGTIQWMRLRDQTK